MKAAGILLAAAVAAGAASCGEPRPVIRVAIHSAPVELDPHLQNESLTSAVLANVYEALTDFGDDVRIRPELASGWRNPDEQTWVFTLRPGARFHDGRPVEAEDVVFSLDRARRHPGTAVANYLVEVETVRALDPRSVEIRTRRPYASLLANLAQVYVVPRNAPERIVEPVGTGPYRIAARTASALELVPVAREVPGRGATTPLRFVVQPDPKRRLRMLLTGEVDVAADLDESAVGVLREAPCCREEILRGSTVEYLQLSSSDPRFRDRRVREAVHLSLDRHGYVAEAHGGLGQPVGQLAVPGVFGYAPDLLPPERDLARARALLAEAGLPRGFDVDLEFRPGRRADVVARQLAEAGIRVKLAERPWVDLYRRLRAGEVGFYFGGLVSPTAESSDVLDGYVHTFDPADGYGASNHARYSNPRADALIESASASFSLVKRREALQGAMRIAMDDLRLIPVAGLCEVYGARRDVDFTPRVDLKLLGREIVRR